MFVLDRVAEFYWLNSRAPWFICAAEFSTIKFYLVTIALRHSNLGERVNVRRSIFKQSLSTQTLLNLIVFLRPTSLLSIVKLQVAILNILILSHSSCYFFPFFSNSSKYFYLGFWLSGYYYFLVMSVLFCQNKMYPSDI